MDKIKRFFNKIRHTIILWTILIGFALILIGFGLSRRSFHVYEPNFPLAIVGIIILTPFVIYLFLPNRRLDKNQEKREEKQIAEFAKLKSNSIQIELNLGELKIISFNDKKPDFNNSTVGELNKKINQDNSSINKVVFEFLLFGKKTKYSLVTDKSLDNLRIHFAIKKTTKLHYHNENKIYIDFGFLELKL